MPMTYAGKHVSVYAWGAGPTVLLVHGWSGRGAQMGAFADPLVAAGYRVIAFEAPAHGRSQGEATNLPEISALIRTLAETLGPVHAVIAHSFGVACTLLALSEGLSLTRVVAISPPDTIEGLVSKFAAGLKLPRAAVAVMRERFEAQFGRDLWTRFSPLRLAQNTKTAALIIHDDADQEVPWQEGEALARAWPGAQFLRTRGLGHRRILRDPAVTVRAARFLTLGEASPGDAG
jgi:pimeloyl-ACP methyl ester carboxylesterase